MRCVCVCFDADYLGCLYQTDKTHDLARYLVYVGFDRNSTIHQKCTVALWRLQMSTRKRRITINHTVNIILIVNVYIPILFRLELEYSSRLSVVSIPFCEYYTNFNVYISILFRRELEYSSRLSYIALAVDKVK